MAVQLQAQTQESVDTLLHAKQNAERGNALKQIVALPDTDQIERYLLERLRLRAAEPGEVAGSI